MEDAVIVVPSFLTLPTSAVGACNLISSQGSDVLSALHFFGVYDGHGGSQAALCRKNHLHNVLTEEMSTVADACNERTAILTWDSYWQKAFASCFSRMDREVDST